MVNLNDGWSYQLRYIRCGKPTCRVCAYGVGHGPYWYAYRRVNGYVRSRYVGKNLPADAFDKAPDPEPAVDPRWQFNGRMDGKQALRIMGFDVWPTKDAAKKRWRQLVNIHHPDRPGGDVRICGAINVAYHYFVDEPRR